MVHNSPSGGLFPKHNLNAVRNSSSEEYLRNVETLTNASDSEETDSIETHILNDILEEQYLTDIQDFKDRLRSNRFFLSQQYNIKSGRPYDNGANTDFIKYNQRIEQEYKLRDKLDNLLRDSSSKPHVNIVDSEKLHKNYVGGDELVVSGSRYTPMKDVYKMLTRPLRSKRATHLKQNSDIILEHMSTGSTNTQIIDMEKHGDWVIDNDNIPKARYNVLESWISTSKSPDDRQKRRNNSFFWKKYNAIINSNYSAQRKLEARHIQMIASGSSLGVGLFLTSGKAFSIAGPFGALVGYLLCASIVMASTLSFAELCALIPLTSGFSGLASRFVEDAFGFALGWLYWFSFIIALPSQVVASTTLLNYYDSLDIDNGVVGGFVTLFLAFAIGINVCDVRVFGNIIYYVTSIKIAFTILMIFAMIVLNTGGKSLGYERVGFRFWDSEKSPLGLTYGLFRPTFDLKDEGTGSLNGVSGATGRLLAVFLSMLIAAFTYSGIEMSFVASCEVKNPKKALPSAMKRTLYSLLLIYLLSVLVVGLNIYAGDPRLPRFYSFPNGSAAHNIMNNVGMSWQVSDNCPLPASSDGTSISYGDRSSWVIALRSFGRCTFASVLNAILIFFGVTSGCSSLYGASHTLYSMAIQEKAPRVFKTCTSNGVPWLAVVFSGMFGITSYMVLDRSSLNNFQVLVNIASATICIIWAGMNVSFLRFYYALKIRPDIISRDDPMFPYRSPFQPYLSYYGLVGSMLMVIFAGFTSFFHGFWSLKMFFSCYGGLIYFIVAYTGYKIFGTSKLQRLDQVDMDVGRVEMDRAIWKEDKEYQRSWKEKLSSLVTWIY